MLVLVMKNLQMYNHRLKQMFMYLAWTTAIIGYIWVATNKPVPMELSLIYVNELVFIGGVHEYNLQFYVRTLYIL